MTSVSRRFTARTRTRRLARLATCAAVCFACGPEKETARGTGANRVVYDNDDRLDVYAHPNATLRARGRESTCAMMQSSALDMSDPNNIRFNVVNLGTVRNLCPTERFRNDPAAASCSATLIDDDLVLTAGHCIDASRCGDYRFVFRFYRDGPGSLRQITSEDVFACAEVVVRRYETISEPVLDFAVVRLDRSAAPRFTPAPVRPGDPPLAPGANVAVIGSGSGIPYKIDSGGAVRSNRSTVLDYFVATTDTFGGNSGSGVYETDQYTVAGILVRGENDYVARGDCYVVNTCPENGCRGEDSTYVARAITDLCRVSNRARLCGEPPPPPPPTVGGTLPFSAADTHSATANTVNHTVTLDAGQTITFGTCGLPNATFTGDTYLRLFADGSEVAFNDDACGAFGSQLTYTSTDEGDVEIRAGCFSTGDCAGVVAW